MLQNQCNPCKWLVMALVLAALWAPDAAPAAGARDCSSAPYRQFDFWLGEWEVSLPDGRKAGRNRITFEQSDCVLVERWQGVEGTTGLSMNLYDPVGGKWRQLWVSPQEQIDISGGLRDGSMVLEGTLVQRGHARARKFRGTWTPLDDGRVRQFFEEAADDGTWTPWFEGLYRRVEAPEVLERE